jgi:hypothetical protein
MKGTDTHIKHRIKNKNTSTVQTGPTVSTGTSKTKAARYLDATRLAATWHRGSSTTKNPETSTYQRAKQPSASLVPMVPVYQRYY